ncbi:hypothetical protein NESM_000894400 [Novymonas esmeraldas]|uniref:Uncharacterized protein n=1 Tax=Novymonas esmeraldas TaxID=1808958 RepID=A0AAW0EZL8_9TRYP
MDNTNDGGMTPEMQKIHNDYKSVVALATAVLRGAELEQAKRYAWPGFMSAYTHLPVPGTTHSGSTTDLNSFLERRERRDMCPGAAMIDFYIAKERCFDAANTALDFKKDLMAEFYSKAHAGQLDPSFVVFMGMTLAPGRSYEKDDMEKRVHRLAHIWMREPPHTQMLRYNNYRTSEMAMETVLPIAHVFPNLAGPLFPQHSSTAGRNTRRC